MINKINCIQEYGHGISAGLLSLNVEWVDPDTNGIIKLVTYD